MELVISYQLHFLEVTCQHGENSLIVFNCCMVFHVDVSDLINRSFTKSHLCCSGFLQVRNLKAGEIDSF